MHRVMLSFNKGCLSIKICCLEDKFIIKRNVPYFQISSKKGKSNFLVYDAEYNLPLSTDFDFFGLFKRSERK